MQAWSRLNPERVVPDRITPAKFKANRPRNHLSVYRLEGVGPNGTAIIAKRREPGAGRVERTVYERVLPHVPLEGPAFHGVVSEGESDASWLFIGEIHGDKYDSQRHDHRAAAGRWLGILNANAASAPGLADLPDAGPARYRAQMRTTRDLIHAAADNPAFSADDLAFLDGLLGQFDQLDEHWDRLEQECSGLPPTLIHGDFNGKNLRVQASPQGAQLVVFDWEDAGRGVPGIDLAQAVSPACRIGAMPDLTTYAAEVRRRWPACGQKDIERLAFCGTVFRVIAVLAWDAEELCRPWADGFLVNLRMYSAELAEALRAMGWKRPLATCAPALGGQAG